MQHDFISTRGHADQLPPELDQLGGHMHLMRPVECARAGTLTPGMFYPSYYFGDAT